MNKIQMFSLSLAAVLAGPVHAQGCSGGNDGGMDATGNQCSTLIEVAALAAGSAIAPPTQITKTGRVWASASAALPAVRLVKMSSQDSAPTARAVPASGKLRAAAPSSVPAKTAKTAAGSEAFCSGGAGGGMDLNGAECGEASAAAESAVIYASARHN
jgi:hypothetical protein